MRSSRCVFNTAVALHRVFIAPVEQSSRRQLSTILTPHPSRPSIASKLHELHFQRRSIVSSAKAEKSRLPRDDEIKAWSVTLVDEDGKLSESTRSTAAILEEIDRKKESLVVVVPGEPGVPPVCRIMNKEAMREAEKLKRKNARSGGSTTKTIELNWALDMNDLGHRIKKMKEFLSKGYKLEVILAEKRRGRKATEQEGKEVLKRIRAGVAEVDGAKESKDDPKGKMLGPMTLFFEGKKSN